MAPSELCFRNILNPNFFWKIMLPENICFVPMSYNIIESMLTDIREELIMISTRPHHLNQTIEFEIYFTALNYKIRTQSSGRQFIKKVRNLMWKITDHLLKHEYTKFQVIQNFKSCSNQLIHSCHSFQLSFNSNVRSFDSCHWLLKLLE